MLPSQIYPVIISGLRVSPVDYWIRVSSVWKSSETVRGLSVSEELRSSRARLTDGGFPESSDPRRGRIEERQRKDLRI